MQLLLQRHGTALVLAGALGALAVGIHGTNRVLERYPGSAWDPAHVGALPDGRVLRVLSVGFERLVADLFWLRTVYYIGDEEVAKAGYPHAARLGRLVTDVDPFFWTAYIHLNSVLTVLREEPDQAIALLEKAEAHGSDHWRVYFLQGFNQFFFRQDYLRAADYMRRAAGLGGPDYLPLLASRLYAHTGDEETAIAFLRARLQSAESDKVRRRLRRRLRNLVIARDLHLIDEAIERYGSVHGTAPAAVATLVEAGLLASEPRDPAGRSYRIREGRAVTLHRYREVRVRGAEEER